MSIVNSYDQCKAAGGDRIFITYYKREKVFLGRWVVIRIMNGKEVKTDPKAAWYDYHHMTFIVGGRYEKKEQLAAAIAWVAEKYGPREFVRNRMGDYVERDVNEQFPLRKNAS